MAYNIIAVGNDTLPATTSPAKSTVTVAVTAGTEVIDSYSTGANTVDVGASGTVHQIAQSFTNGNFGAIKSIGLTSGGPQGGGAIVGNVTLALYSDESGEPGVSLGSTTFNNETYPADGAAVTATFGTAIVVEPFAKYWIFLGVADQSSATKGPIVDANTSTTASSMESTDGSTWSDITTTKLHFTVSGAEPAMTSDDKVIIIPTSAVPRDIKLENSWYVSAKAGGSFTLSSSFEGLSTAMTFDYFIVSGSQDE